MRVKSFHATPWAALLILIVSPAISAQTAQVSGKITLKQSDGGVVPVHGAQIDIYRTDIAFRAETTTDAAGEYVRPGLASLGVYTIAVSARGARPEYRSGLRLTAQPVQNFVLLPGDGSRLTLEGIKATIAGAASPSRANEGVAAQNGERDRINEILSRTFRTGNEALTAANVAVKNNEPDLAIKKFSAAIAQFDEGLAADPQQPAILVNKAVALKGRGVERFNAALKLRDAPSRAAASQPAKDDLQAAAETSRKAVVLVNSQGAPADQAEAARYRGNKYAALFTHAESMRLYVSKVEPTQVDAGAAAFKEYLSAETDPVKKLKGRFDLAQMLLDAGHGDRASSEFRAILAEVPDHIEANLGMGMALYSTGDKAKLAEVQRYFQRFVDLAPDSHSQKADVKLILAQLKNQ